MKRLWSGLAPLVLAGCLLSGCGDPAVTVTPAPGAPANPSAALPSAALPPENPAPGDHALAFLLPDGTRRDYLVHAPPGYSVGTAYPLVLVFHGSPGTATGMPELTGMNPVADANDFLVVYPDQFTDPAEVAALLDHLIPRWGVDPRRVHAAGFSRGATFTYQVAYRLPDRFGAVAPVSGVAPQGEVPALSQPVSLLTLQGSRDRIGQGFPRSNADWDRAAGCRDERTASTTLGNETAHVYTTTCAGGAEHVVYSVVGLGHAWPDEASELIWTFFQRHPRP